MRDFQFKTPKNLFKVGVQITGDDKIIDAIASLNQDVSDLREAFAEAAQLFYAFERQAFETEGGSSRVGKWKKLTPRYARWKSIKYPGQPILQLTGALRASLTRSGARGSKRVITMASMTLGTTIPYAMWLQTGTRKMVARPPVALTKAQEKSMFLSMTRNLGLKAKKKGWLVTDLVNEAPVDFVE